MLDLLLESFLLGLFTPLTAVCVLPLYPAFLSYLSNALSGSTENRKWMALFGITIAAGVIVFMLLLGLLFTTLLQVSLTDVIGVVSPLAFGLMGILGIVLLAGKDVGGLLPTLQIPRVKNPLIHSFLYGFFFGAIVVPCNPAFIAVLFARSLLVTDPISNILQFLFFGMGIGAPLLLFSLISTRWSKVIIGWLTKHQKHINQLSGIVLLTISIYYLVFVFKVISI